MILKYLLDTNICIYIAKKQPKHVLTKFEHMLVGEVAMSTITYGELYYGAEKSLQKEKNIMILDQLTKLIPPISISNEAGKFYGQIRSELEQKGIPIRNNDLWIASHALSLNVTLISNNLKEFTRIPNLQLENWV